MVKPEWGTKRTCPKCATRFYDLGNDTPVTCINCSVTWDPEPILKSKQPLPYEEAAPKPEIEVVDGDLAVVDADLPHQPGREPLELVGDDGELDAARLQIVERFG